MFVAWKTVSQYQLVTIDFLTYALDYTVHPRSVKNCLAVSISST